MTFLDEIAAMTPREQAEFKIKAIVFAYKAENLGLDELLRLPYISKDLEMCDRIEQYRYKMSEGHDIVGQMLLRLAEMELEGEPREHTG